MIVTVTPSPAIDWTITVDSFELGGVNRSTQSVREPSGKGVNVSIALHRGDVATLAIVPAGGDTGRFLASTLAGYGVPVSIIDSGVDVRTNITLVAPGQPGTKINEPGAALSADTVWEIQAAILATEGVATAVLVCGSLPPGVPTTFHRDVVVQANRMGAFSVVDASGEALSAALEARPGLVKPNVHELAELTGRDIATLGDVVDAAEAVRALGAGAVLASLGADGVVFVDDDGPLFAVARDIPVVNAVGAGDALLAGYLSGLAGTADRIERLADAVLWASSAVAHPSTLFTVRPEYARLITAGPLPAADRRLGEPSRPLGAGPTAH
ncbi:MAG: pfkB [Glaciihabitans sp.]|nr:pfkB [Glaciihabitans sp.]